MSMKVLIVVLIVTLCRTSSKKILCQMISLETDDSMSGYCCVFFRNNSEIKAEEEEIKQQILDSFKNATIGEISSRVSQNKNRDRDAVNFPTEEESKIKFPDEMNSEDLKNVYADDRKEPIPSENVKNDTTHNIDKSKNKTSSNETVTVIPVNRNAVDVPETCPDGNEKDFNGDCVPVF